MKKFLIVLSIVLLSLGLFWGIVNLIPVHKSIKETNPWRKTDKVLISAHRGGAELNPENTKMAFDYVIKETSYTDIVEIDVLLTKDNVVVINHDDTVNDMALPDGSDDVRIDSHSFAELKAYNLGRNFENLEGKRPYENYTLEQAEEAGLTIMSIEDFFREYNGYRDFKVFVEIKDDETKCRQAIDEIEKLIAMEEYSWWDDRIMYISFTSDVVDYTLENYEGRYVACMGFGMVPQLAGSILRLDSLIKSEYHSIQTSMVASAGPISINCATKRFVKSAHKRNQSVVYWTIDNEEDMLHLIDIGADVITTDRPDVLAKLIGKI